VSLQCWPPPHESPLHLRIRARRLQWFYFSEKPVRSKRTLLIGTPLAAALLLVFWVESPVQRSSRFAGLQWAGTTSENYSAFFLSLTNQSLTPSGTHRILFQWVDKAGARDSCHAELHQLGTESNGVWTAHIGVPADAKKLRVLLCEPPGAARNRAQGVLQKLPWRLQALIPRRWVYTDEFYSPLLPWTANPAHQATAAASRS